jgi:sphingomyelin phosphodiesterase
MNPPRQYITVLLLLTLVLMITALVREEEDVFHFWQITDPHIDEFYSPNSVANCDEIICCRANSKVKANTKAKLSGKFGSPLADCDIPLITFEGALQFIHSYYPDQYKLDNEMFVFYGGDNTAHDDWDYSKDRIVNQMLTNHKSMFQILRNSSSAFQSLVLSAIGNHDTYPIDQFDLPPGSSWYLDPFADIMKQSGIIDTDTTLKTMREFGYYTVVVRPKLRILVLNTQYEDILNFFLYKSTQPDPGQQLAFIESVLSNAKLNQEKVIVLGHIPYGITDGDASPQCSFAFTKGFTELMEQYSDNVILSAWGHTHKDSFRLVMDKATGAQAKHIGFITPSVTTWTEQQPSVRLFKLNKTTYELVDVVTFISNVTQANIDGFMTFKQEYSAKETYNLSDLSPASWYRVANQFVTNDTVWNTFSSLYFNNMARICSASDKKCRLKHYCNTVTTQVERYADCILN